MKVLQKCAKWVLVSGALLCSQLAYAEPRAYIVYNYTKGKILEQKNPHTSLPIASVTKLMTAVTFLRTQSYPNQCVMTINYEDKDFIKGTGSRLPKNTPITCNALISTMLIASDNTAAHALSRAGNSKKRDDFLNNMNGLASSFGMVNTHFADSSGLSPQNRSSVHDLVRLAHQAMRHPEIKDISSALGVTVNYTNGSKGIAYNNTNRLITRYGHTSGVLLSKTGYIREAGFNLLMVKQNDPRVCQNGDAIMVISLGHPSSAQRFQWTGEKLTKYCNWSTI